MDPRIQWVREWPGQVVICVNQILDYWTAEVHEAIRAGPQGLKEYHDKLKSQVSTEDSYIRTYCCSAQLKLADIINFEHSDTSEGD